MRRTPDEILAVCDAQARCGLSQMAVGILARDARDLVAEVEALRARAEKAERERDRYRALWSRSADAAVRLKARLSMLTNPSRWMSSAAGKRALAAGGGVFQCFAGLMWALVEGVFDETPAENYIETVLTRPRDGAEFVMRVQRGGKPTPHDFRMAAEKRAQDAERAIATARQSGRDDAARVCDECEAERCQVGDEAGGGVASWIAGRIRDLTNTGTTPEEE